MEKIKFKNVEGNGFIPFCKHRKKIKNNPYPDTLRVGSDWCRFKCEDCIKSFIERTCDSGYVICNFDDGSF